MAPKKIPLKSERDLRMHFEQTKGPYNYEALLREVPKNLGDVVRRHLQEKIVPDIDRLLLEGRTNQGVIYEIVKGYGPNHLTATLLARLIAERRETLVKEGRFPKF
ncbi:MAG: hypothetical protein NUV67_00090 [archaeon]|nr:hypothetical protein [archaeon]